LIVLVMPGDQRGSDHGRSEGRPIGWPGGWACKVVPCSRGSHHLEEGPWVRKLNCDATVVVESGPTRRHAIWDCRSVVLQAMMDRNEERAESRTIACITASLENGLEVMWVS